MDLIYNLSISFTTPSPDRTTMLSVMVTDAVTGAPVTGLIQNQFNIYVLAPFAEYQELAIIGFQGLPFAPFPGVYFMLVNWSPIAPGSIAFAVAVTAAPIRSVVGEVLPPIGMGIGTYVSLVGLSTAAGN
jgi:hypothetical protein